MLKKYWPSLVHVAAVGVAFLTPSVQSFAASHLAYSAPLLALWGIALHHFPSPLQK